MPTKQSTTVDYELPRQVEHVLREYLNARLAECADLDTDFATAAHELASFALNGGKRTRPAFAWWGWRASGGDPEGPEAEAMLRAASALELIQVCALVHDDVIDDSDTRRGHPAMHRLFSQNHACHEHSGSSQRFGMSVAVLLGDLALAWSDDMLREAGLGTEAWHRALRPWRAMRTEMLAGQYIDVLGQARREETIEAALRVDELKAASYTVLRPLQLGAEIAGADPATLTALNRFGSDIGVAFQLRDDLLGVFGDPDITGKPAGDDLREGKRTVLIAEAIERAHQRGDTASAELIRGVLDDPAPSPADIEQTRDVLLHLGASDAVEARIGDLTGTALAALHGADLAEPAASTLAELALAATTRTH